VLGGKGCEKHDGTFHKWLEGAKKFMQLKEGAWGLKKRKGQKFLSTLTKGRPSKEGWAEGVSPVTPRKPYDTQRKEGEGKGDGHRGIKKRPLSRRKKWFEDRFGRINLLTP